MTEIGGSVEAGFEGVADAFRQNFVDHGEVGAATSVYVGGKKVVDLWGGVADPTTGAPYTEDSLQLVFSTTKGATAVCAGTSVVPPAAVARGDWTEITQRARTFAAALPTGEPGASR